MRLFLPNPGFARELFSEDPEAPKGVAAEAERAARIIRTQAHEIMPREDADAQIIVEETEAGAQILNTDHGAAIDEFGTAYTPAYAPMRRGVRAAGFRLVEDSATGANPAGLDLVT